MWLWNTSQAFSNCDDVKWAVFAAHGCTRGCVQWHVCHSQPHAEGVRHVMLNFCRACDLGTSTSPCQFASAGRAALCCSVRAGERPSLQATYNAARAVHLLRCGLHTRDAARGSCSTLLLCTQARCKFNQFSCSLEGKFMIWVGFFRNERRAARFCLINNEKESFRTAGS